MARQKQLDDLMFYAILAGGAYVGYKTSLDGKWGPALQSLAERIQDLLNLKVPPIGGGPPGGSKCSIPATGNLSVMQAGNVNILQQIQEWQAARKAAGQTPYDWQAFRMHLGGIGAPDPGPNPPSIFCQ